MKKFITIGVFVFAFALAAAPAFGMGFFPSADQSNVATNVSGTVYSSANSGGNSIEKGSFYGSTSIITGATSATTYGINAVNSNLKYGAFTMGSQKNTAWNVEGSVIADANSGVNEIEKGKFYGDTSIKTNTATSYTKGINLVNTNLKVVRSSMWSN